MKNIIENIAIYAVKKILNYLVKKYKLDSYFDAIEHIEDKNNAPKK